MDKNRIKTVLGVSVMVIGFMLISVGVVDYFSSGSNDPNGNDITGLSEPRPTHTVVSGKMSYDEVFEAYPTPQSLWDALQNGTETCKRIPDELCNLVQASYNHTSNGGLVVPVP